jgi:predicted AlkP superfamily phosphohydrolase/phosphomutase
MILRTCALFLLFTSLDLIAIAGSNSGKRSGSGILDLLPGDTVQKPVENLQGKSCWSNPNIAGVVLRGTWGKFEPAANQYDWSYFDYFMMVDIGVDRIQHAFWACMDKTHRNYRAGNSYENAILDYYQLVDTEIGELLKFADKNTAVLVVSDHRAQKMEGSICINEWLIKEGYLALLETPTTPTPFAKLKVDWSKTKAWGDGSYYSRIFLNLKGCEPQGAVDASQYDRIRSELIEKIEAIPDEKGRRISTKVFRPEELYQTRNGVAPDLMVYFGNLAWRSADTVGRNSIHTFENDWSG